MLSGESGQYRQLLTEYRGGRVRHQTKLQIPDGAVARLETTDYGRYIESRE